MNKKKLLSASLLMRNLFPKVSTGATAKRNSDFRSALNGLINEKKLLAIMVFSLLFTQIHRIGLMFPESETFLGVTLTNWPDWETLVGISFFVASGAIVAAFMITILPKTISSIYQIPLVVLFLVNGFELINILLDRPETIENEFFSVWHTVLPLSLFFIYQIRKFVQASPHEENKLLRSENELLRYENDRLKDRINHLSYSELVDVFNDLQRIKFSTPEIQSHHDIESWKRVLISLVESPIDGVVDCITKSLNTLKPQQND